MSAPNLSVLVLDDHRVFADSLTLGLNAQPDLRCVAAAHSVQQALRQVEVSPVDVLLVDLDLPDARGVDAVVAVRAACPAARVVVLTAHARSGLAERALSAGAVGFLGKHSPLSRIVDAIRTADASHPVVDSPGSGDAPRVELTHREQDVLDALAQGLDATLIAAQLGISVFTVRDHLKALMSKLGVHSQLGALVAAGRLGLVRIGAGY